MNVLYKSHYDSPIGKLWIVSDEMAIKGIWFDNQRHFAAGYSLAAIQQAETDSILALKKWLKAYFNGERCDVSALSLAPVGTVFQQQVWQILMTIPYGETMSYAEIAAQIWTDSAKGSPRAVGGAVGKNPIAICIPCHRVIGSKGAITGYAGGLEKKQWLLEHEMKR
ncbi:MULTISPECIES: methylated-DNA--[protein]-cysteine S-methyltransferase [unclassified Facklamia]|uniref:methylated-DNA--[protein]-cysteine S-methyltransferase n=1 Tax=Aerococcaceae TaxID=186827 RepID=UPI0013BA64E7|nr:MULTISPECIES: methylated-DNA--[protein]-cysteine S-methyltransferase [unclassified Facklamia]NEW65189.1 methylated-DNA--[protein]-cysteine S-methyltransferase [Facklamia sp. 252]NEW68580.1 methylated-DNA--[protein]-cysteine S-methyltransferase [Facklamia sp. 253]QQD65992.1 methylated-DNA--[protein]-cysteine S-methyltransferase [Aerococcaceae bacterium zg-252]